MRILVTGGAGYIGSHTALQLLQQRHEVVILDNLSNSSPIAVERIDEIAGGSPLLHRCDLRDGEAVERVFASARIDAVIHFAGLKAVGESTEVPLRYYDNNVAGTVVLLETMQRHGVHDLIFSSSATVYGGHIEPPLREDAPLGATNPYGRTKLMIEEIMRDVARSDDRWRFVLLRYFNPVGAHESGRIGEDPIGIPNNLMPFVMQVAVGRRDRVRVFGGDYPTPDGTGIRDYIHVVDLAAGHLAALDALPETKGCVAYNLGTGRGSSVLEVVAAASRAVGRDIPYEIVDRRPGDVAVCFADPALAQEKLGWRAERDLDAMCADHWRWQQANPDGYRAGT